MTIDIERLVQARDMCLSTANAVKTELHMVAGDPTANRASLEVYRGEYREAREYYDQLIINNAEDLIAELQAAREVMKAAKAFSKINGDDQATFQYLLDAEKDLSDSLTKYEEACK